MQSVLNSESVDKMEIIATINDYNKLKVAITRSIGRIRSVFN